MMDAVSIETVTRGINNPVKICFTATLNDEMRGGNGLLLVQLPYVELIHGGDSWNLYWLLPLDRWR